MDNKKSELEESEYVIARALRAMFNSPGSQEDYDARVAYLLFCKKMHPEDRERLEKMSTERRTSEAQVR